MKVLLFAGGGIGQIVRNVLEQHDNVELVEFDRGYASLSMWATSDELPEFDILFSASPGIKIPVEFCKRAKIGAFNLHTGLLPEGRGFHPLNWALIWGSEKTGITIHEIVESYDAGDVVAQHEVPVFDQDTIRMLRQRVDDFVPQVVSGFFDDPQHFINAKWKQNQAHVTYAPRRYPSDSEINFDASEKEIWDLWRSCDPDQYPAFVVVDDRMCPVVDMSYRDGKLSYKILS